MILIAIGSNLSGPLLESSREICDAALNLLERHDIRIAKRSRWYRSSPVPAYVQPVFINGIFSAESGLGPVPLLRLLHETEDRFGRTRSRPNAARTLDLDLIDYRGCVRPGPEAPILPHPRLAERAFVLLPVSEIAPGWRHPVTGEALADLIAALPPGQTCVPDEG